MKISVWVGASRRRIGRGYQPPHWPGLSRGKAKRTLTGPASVACLAANRPMQVREAAIQTRVGDLSPSRGSDVKDRDAQGIAVEIDISLQLQTVSEKSMERQRNSIFSLRTVLVTKSQLQRKARPEGCAQPDRQTARKHPARITETRDKTPQTQTTKKRNNP